MPFIFIVGVSLFLAIHFLANYDKIRAHFLHQLYRITIYKDTTTGKRFTVYSTTIYDDKKIARIIAQDLLEAIQGYEQSILTYEITEETISVPMSYVPITPHPLPPMAVKVKKSI